MDYFDDSPVELSDCFDALNDPSILTFLDELLTEEVEPVPKKTFNDDFMFPELTKEHFNTLPYKKIPENLFEISFGSDHKAVTSQITMSLREMPCYIKIKCDDITRICKEMTNGYAIVPIRKSSLVRPNIVMNIPRLNKPRRRHYSKSK